MKNPANGSRYIRVKLEILVSVLKERSTRKIEELIPARSPEIELRKIHLKYLCIIDFIIYNLLFIIVSKRYS